MLSTTRGPGRPWGARAWWNLQGGATAGRRTEGTRGRRGRGSGQGRWSWPQGGPAVLQIDRYAQQDLKKGLHLYGTPGNVGLTNAWSIIQTDFRCCGVSNYTDWFEVYNATRVPDSCCLEFSESCGLHAPGTWWKAPCYETVKMWLQENLLAVGVFGLCTALVQILGLTFAMTMYCQVVSADTYCA